MIARSFMTGVPNSAKLFAWQNGHGVAELSDLGKTFELHQVWQDSIDVGFTVMSDRTGVLVTFVQTNRIREHGELVKWVYKSIDKQTGRVDRTKYALTITIFND